jgi:hypothetical protein
MAFALELWKVFHRLTASNALDLSILRTRKISALATLLPKINFSKKGGSESSHPLN